MKLSEVAFENIKINQAVKGATGKLGKVTRKWLQQDRFDERWVDISWEDDSFNCNWLSWMDKIEVIND